MKTAVKDAQVNFRINSDILTKAKANLAKQNKTLSNALAEYIEEEAQKNIEVPEEFEAEKVFKKLQKEILIGYQAAQEGKIFSVAEVREQAKTWKL